LVKNLYSTTTQLTINETVENGNTKKFVKMKKKKKRQCWYIDVLNCNLMGLAIS